MGVERSEESGLLDEKLFAGCDLLEGGPSHLRRKRLRLGMMHYHLKYGGVISVMRDMADALRRHSRYEELRIDILSSMADEGRAKKVFGWTGSDGSTQLNIEEIPGLSYNSNRYPDRSSFMKAADRLAHEIIYRIDLTASTPEMPYVLHSHNISLGKNPTATMAFKRVAEMAVEKSLPLWLINQVHDFSENNRPEQVRAFMNCTGRRDEAFALTFMYPNSPNILYVTINSSDILNLLTIGIPEERIFLLPDPINVRQYEETPLWEKDYEELAVMKLLPADYKKAMLLGLSDYAAANDQIFNASLPILLSPVKLIRRKNHFETLLLLMLFEHLGRSYQLLITLDANSPPDIAYSRRFKQFVSSRNMPVVTGCGKDIVSGTGRARVINGKLERFGMGDLYALCSAVITTSIVEGFGLVYHEGWLSRKIVAGRKIEEITGDFEKNGMDFSHMYDRLAVALTDLPDLRKRLCEAYDIKTRRLFGGWGRSADVKRPEVLETVEAKIFRAGNEACIDFADLSVDMQIELLGLVAEDPELAGRLIDRNPAVRTTHTLLEGCASGSDITELVETNVQAVRKRYSLEAMAQRLEHLFEIGDSLYRNKSEGISLTPENHNRIMQRYRAPEHVRLIF